jgi:HEAT repeat protein
LASATFSDPLLYGVLVSALAVTAISVLLLVLIALLRIQLVRRERRSNAVLDRWRPLLARAAAGDLADAPPINNAEGELLLPLWNQLRESVRGRSEASLDAFAQRIGLDRTARSVLISGNARVRLLAINTLGHIGTAGDLHDGDELERSLRDVGTLLRLCHDDDAIVSLAAVRALLRMDSTWALPRLVPLMLERVDWSIVRLSPMLRAADTARLELVLADALSRVGGAVLERLLLIAAVLPQERTSRWARTVLDQTENEAHITAALRLVSDPRDAPVVRRFLKHPAWQVRVRAVTALERVASAEDLPRLVMALADPEWWVRLRAARTLARLPFLDGERLARLCDTVSDRFAHDALVQAIAEEHPS